MKLFLEHICTTDRVMFEKLLADYSPSPMSQSSEPVAIWEVSKGKQPDQTP
jgi:hypothetical protein